MTPMTHQEGRKTAFALHKFGFNAGLQKTKVLSTETWSILVERTKQFMASNCYVWSLIKNDDVYEFINNSVLLHILNLF